MKAELNIYIFLLSIISMTIFSSAIFSSCDDGEQLQYDFKFPEDETITFSKHVQPFIMLRCSSYQCHGDQSQAGGRRLTDYSSYFVGVNAGSLVLTSDPNSSLLLQVVDGRNPHLDNLRLLPVLKNQSNGIRRWIENGAIPD